MTKKHVWILGLSLLLVTSCTAEIDTGGTQQMSTSTTQAMLRLPTDQIFAFVNSYIASRDLEPQPNNLQVPSIDEITRCVQNAATNFGESILQTFKVQAIAETAVMQAIQQNIEQFIAQCSIK